MIVFVKVMFFIHLLSLVINIVTLDKQKDKQKYYSTVGSIFESFVIVLWAACLIWQGVIMLEMALLFDDMILLTDLMFAQGEEMEEIREENEKRKRGKL